MASLSDHEVALQYHILEECERLRYAQPTIEDYACQYRSSKSITQDTLLAEFMAKPFVTSDLIHWSLFTSFN